LGAGDAGRSAALSVVWSLERVLVSLFFHRELVDGVGFWVAALLFVVAVVVVLRIVVKWVRELSSRGKDR
jgi:hypothetical protein